MKYYWMTYSYANGSGTRSYFQRVCTEHPFKIFKGIFNAAPVTAYISLDNWKAITKEEFDLFYKLS